MDSSIGLPIGIVCACIFSSLLFWYTYRHQVEPEGGRGTQDQLEAELADQIKREIELETQHGLKDNEDVDEALEEKSFKP
jgi:hypothetical protein